MFKKGDKVMLVHPHVGLSEGKAYEVVRSETYAEFCENEAIPVPHILDGVYIINDKGNEGFFFNSRFNKVD